MSWDEHHSRSERLASQGEHVARAGDRAAAEKLYAQAAEAEVAALDGLAPEKLRTRGITSVSAVALWYKAHELSRAEQLAYRSLAGGDLPEFAQAQIRELLTLIWTTRSAEAVLAYPLPAAPPVTDTPQGCPTCGGPRPCDRCTTRNVVDVDALKARLESERLRAAAEIVKLIADDSWAIAFQSLGQYRSALLKAWRDSAPAAPPQEDQ